MSVCNLVHLDGIKGNCWGYVLYSTSVFYYTQQIWCKNNKALSLGIDLAVLLAALAQPDRNSSNWERKSLKCAYIYTVKLKCKM